MAKEPKETYDSEFAIPGRVPSTDPHKKPEEAPEKVQEYRLRLAALVKDNLTKEGITSYPLAADERVHVTVIHFSNNESFNGTCDVDNFARTVLNGLEGVIYSDDAQVHSLLTAKVHDAGMPDFAYIGIRRIAKGNKFSNVMKWGGVQHAQDVCRKVAAVTA